MQTTIQPTPAPVGLGPCDSPRADRHRPICGRPGTSEYQGPTGVRYTRCTGCASVIDGMPWVFDQGYVKLRADR